ncbi:MAG TPA: hypothetical protein VHV52_11680 [Gaiellaceae bacterium]|jgi:hypothetical protein|nr:hypothetical protein [Gaiellaceae bacterium]
MADPVSWLMIEPGWRVASVDGEEVGRIEAVTGDSNADIFDGLAIASGVVARPRYVPAEQIAEITDGLVRLSLDKTAIEQLPEYDVPAAEIDVEPEKASLLQRAEAGLVRPNEREHRTGLVRRVLDWFGLAGRR